MLLLKLMPPAVRRLLRWTPTLYTLVLLALLDLQVLLAFLWLLSSLQTVVETLICTVFLSRLRYFRHVCCSSKHGTSTCRSSPSIGTHNVRFCRGLQLASDPQ